MVEKFSVLMSVYYKEKPDYLEECLLSLANQTLPADEIVLVEDGPLTKELYAVINSYKNRLPIKSVILIDNKGLAEALNYGLKNCSYDLIARMDTDDISLESRFFEQVSFMSANPNIAASSSYIEERSDDMKITICTKKLPLVHHELLKFATFRSPLSHPATIFRKSAVLSAGGYPKIYPEDYPLWISMLNSGFIFANIPKVLVLMRAGNGMLSRRGKAFLPGYIQCYKLLRDFGMISSVRYYTNVFIQSVIRNLPLPLLKILYSISR